MNDSDIEVRARKFLCVLLFYFFIMPLNTYLHCTSYVL